MSLLLSPYRRFVFALGSLLLGLAPAAPSLAQTCPFDDGNSSLAVEGLILARYALGMTGSALVAGTGIDAADAPVVEATVSCPSCGLNITGNANMTVTDATIISRRIAGVNVDSLTTGLDLGSGTRNTATAVKSFLLAGCGNVNVPASCNTNQIIKWNGSAWACANVFPVCDYGATLVADGFGGMTCSLPANIVNTVDNAASVGAYSAIAVPSDGLPIIAYYDASNGDLKVAKCSSSSCTGSATISTVDSTGLVGVAPSIAVSALGVARISYTDSTNGDLKLAICNNVSCSSSSLVVVDSVGNVGAGSAIALTADGRATISYRDLTNFTVKVARCNDSSCTAPTRTTLEAASAGFEGTAIALTASGFPVVGYLNTPATTANPRVALCGDLACTTGNTFVSFTSSSTLDQIAVAVSPSGLPAWSVYDVTNGQLKFTTCFNNACSSGTITTTPDSAGTVGSYSSLAIGADGRPVIAYYDVTNGDLKVLKCGNTQCSSKNRISTVDSAGTVGLRPSLALPADGLPVISYYDSTNSALKVVKCRNDACSP